MPPPLVGDVSLEGREFASRLAITLARVGVVVFLAWVPVGLAQGDVFGAAGLAIAAVPFPLAVWLGRRGEHLASRVVVWLGLTLGITAGAIFRPIDAGPGAIAFCGAVIAKLLFQRDDPRWTGLLPGFSALVMLYVASRVDAPWGDPHQNHIHAQLAFVCVFVGTFFALEQQQRHHAFVEARLDESVTELDRVAIEADAARLAADAARDEAETATRARSAFLAMMSHEVRTPLNGVLGMTELLRSTTVSPEQREMLDTIAVSGEALLRVLNDILDLSKIEAGALRLEAAAFDPAEVVHQALGHRRGVQVVVDTGGWLVVGDATRWAQAVIRCVDTATAPAALSVRLTNQGGTAELTVRIAELGFPGPETPGLRRLLLATESDRRLDAAWLGAALARRLLDVMGADLGASEDLDARVVVEFRTLHALGTRTPVAATPAHVCPLRPRRVLVAEDNPVNARVITRMLQTFDVPVIRVVEDGAQAVDALESGGWDLVLMDVQMPVMSGHDATRAWRVKERASGARRVYIVALTAGGFVEERASALEAGMDDFLTKPVSREALKRILDGEPVDA